MSMVKYLIILSIVAFSLNCYAGNLYVDAVGADPGFTDEALNCSTPSDDDYDLTTRDCGSGSETVYNTIQGAVTNCIVGDVIQIRNGSWTENIDIPEAKSGTAWTEGNFTTMRSYAGEWAKITANTSSLAVIYNTPSLSIGPTDHLKWWKFERLEITGGRYGFLFNTGPIWFRYCYIHDNIYNTGGDDLTAGIGIGEPNTCIVEYNFLKDNYNSFSSTTNDAQIIFQADDHEAPAYNPDGLAFVPTAACVKNIIRYNYLEGGDFSSSGIHIKRDQRFGLNNRDPETMTYEDYGDQYHHNIILNSGDSILASQDFLQIYKNITDEGIWYGIRHKPITYNLTIYNNTLTGANAMISLQSGIGNELDGGADGFSNCQQLTEPCYPDNGKDNTVKPWAWVYNNVISGNTGSAYNIYPLHFIEYQPEDFVDVAGESYTQDLSALAVEKNLIHTSTRTDTVKIGDCDTTGGGICDEGTPFYQDQTLAEFNSNSDTWRSTSGIENWDVDTAGLFIGESGADQYITDGTYVVDGGTGTIADSGINEAHPYLSGVAFPDYVGATNPDDNDWVAGVLALDVTYMTSASGDPTWIEGSSAPQSSEIGPGTSSTFSAGDSTVIN